MDWESWRPTYEAILADFGWPAEADRAAAAELAGLLPPSGVAGGWPLVDSLLVGQPSAVVVGAGPSLDALEAWPTRLVGRGPVLAADGATTRLRELGVIPTIVVSDLDGNPSDLEWAAGQASVMVVHAHGDNREAMAQLVPRLGDRIAASLQCDPQGFDPRLADNRGGFTDGDRAVMLCEHLGVPLVYLVGFDLASPPGRVSHRYDPVLKPRKLAWAQRILADVAARGVTGTVP